VRGTVNAAHYAALVAVPLLGPNFFLSTLFVNTLILGASLNVRKYDTHTKQQAKL
jgi:hypothetical protein